MTTLISIGVFLVVSIITLFLFYLFLLLIRACVRVFIPTSITSQFSGRSVVLSAGATAVLFWDTTNAVVRGFFVFFLNSLELFSQTLSRYISLIVADPAETEVFQEIQNEMTSLLPQIIRNANEYLYNISVPAVLAALAVFVMLAGAFSGAKAGAEDQAILLRLKNWYVNLEPLRRGRLTLSFAVLFGAYLSIGAILSVPWLYNVNDASPLEESMLRARLTSSTTSNSEWQQQWETEFFTNKPLEPLEKLLGTPELVTKLKEAHEKKINENAEYLQGDGSNVTIKTFMTKEEFDTQVQRVTNSMQEINRQAINLNNQWMELKQDAESKRANSLEEAISAYQNYKDKNLSDRERQRFSDDLVNWYTNRIRNIDEMLRRYQSDVRWYETNWRRWAVDAADDLKRGLALYYYDEPYLELNFDYRSLEEAFYLQPTPSPRDPSEIGIFGFFAQWLISTRSYTVALLFGMIGFGLIGSVVSRALTSVRRDPAVVETQGTFDVILVGVTASTIIFLASQGGLAIFASGDTQPNGYILFLSALIGAAYGDRVWETARERFFERLKQTQQAQEGEEEGEGEETSKKPEKKKKEANKKAKQKAASKKSPADTSTGKKAPEKEAPENQGEEGGDGGNNE